MINRANWFLTKKYLGNYNCEHPHTSKSSIERYGFYLRHLLLWADELSFEEALNNKEPNFSNYVINLPSRRGDGHLAKESQKKIINVSKAFLEWARDTHAIKATNITSKKIRGLVPIKILKSGLDPESVSLSEILQIASLDFGNNLVLQRDLAGLCFAFLSGARASAIATAPIKAIDINKLAFIQDPSIGIKTKNNKSATTFLLPIPELIAVVKRWDDFVRANLSENDTWFAPFENHWGDYSLSSTELGDNRGQAISKRFGVIYEKAGMPELYKSAHKFRHGHALYGLSRCKNMAEYQAVSRNLMHSNFQITDAFYSIVETQERQKIITSLIPQYQPLIESDLQEFLYKLCREDMRQAMHMLADALAR
ncbi:MAG: hypothetical protein WCK35_28270 [Chloroflexota bacterium]